MFWKDFYGKKRVNYRLFDKHIQRTRDLGDYLAIWHSAASRASKGGKSENFIAWEAVTAGKSENSLA